MGYKNSLMISALYNQHDSRNFGNLIQLTLGRETFFFQEIIVLYHLRVPLLAIHFPNYNMFPCSVSF